MTGPTAQAGAWWQLLADLYALRARTGWQAGGVHRCVHRGDYQAAATVLQQLLQAEPTL